VQTNLEPSDKRGFERQFLEFFDLKQFRRKTYQATNPKRWTSGGKFPPLAL